MSVFQRKDGRWVVKFRRGTLPRDPKRSSVYFGRGEEEERKARAFSDNLLKTYGPPGQLLKEKYNILEERLTKFMCGMESEVRDELAYLIEVARGEEENVRTEVFCDKGFIDILTNTEVIEVKHDRKWREGIGQLISYGQEYPGRRLRLHLFKKPNTKLGAYATTKLGNACKAAAAAGIVISLHCRNTYKELKPWHRNVVPIF